MKKIVFNAVFVFLAVQCFCVCAADPAYYVKISDIERCGVEHASNIEDDSITFYYNFSKEVAKTGQFVSENGKPVIRNVQISIFESPVEGITGKTEIFNSDVYNNRIVGAIAALPEDTERVNSSVVLDVFSNASGGDMCLEEGKTYYAYFMMNDGRWSWAWTVKPYVFVYGESSSDKPVITPAPTYEPLSTIKTVRFTQEKESGIPLAVIIFVFAEILVASSVIIPVYIIKKKRSAAK